MPSCEIITIGTEILLGEIVDTNTRHLAFAMRELGIDLYRTVTIGDNVERIADAIRESMGRAEIVLTTGGLGPTVDDPTREAVAMAAGVETEFREELWLEVKAAIARYGRTPTENQRRQAFLPRSAIAISNPVGTAPAFILETALGAVISLPGVPREMELLLHEAVIPYLQQRFMLRDIIKVRLLHTSGLGEGMIDEKIGDLEKLRNPTVGLSAHSGVVDIRIAAKAETEAGALQMIAGLEAELRSRLGDVIFGADGETLETATLAAAENAGWSLAIAGFGLDQQTLRRIPSVLPLEGLQPNQLNARLREIQANSGTTAALGVAAFVADMAVEICVLAPSGGQSRRLTYGGHPGNLPRWAMNTGLHMLRLAASGKP